VRRVASEGMRLKGLEWWRYFVPTLICSYLMLMCLALLVTSWFLPRNQNALTSLPRRSTDCCPRA